jgi:hypothetical protein
MPNLRLTPTHLLPSNKQRRHYWRHTEKRKLDRWVIGFQEKKSPPLRVLKIIQKPVDVRDWRRVIAIVSWLGTGCM